MRVRSYFLIGGIVCLCLVMVFVAWIGVQYWIWTRGRPLFGEEFPTIAHRDTLKITLDRTFCLGRCPDYTIEIRGDGSEQFTGRDYVAVFGKHRSHISALAVGNLIQRFEEIEFFSTLDSYGGQLDASITTISISFDDHYKSVRYIGNASNMPQGIIELERDIDAAANARLWVKGQGDVFAALQAENWNFHATSDENAKMTEAAQERGDTELVRRLAHTETAPREPTLISPKFP